MPLGKVLVVEDDAAIRRGLVDALQVSNYETLEAGDGAQGLSLAIGCEVDIVLLDIMMPGMDGFDVLRELRKAKPTLPVIMLTARGEEADRVRGLKLGSDDYVVKPFSVHELLARVEAVLRRSAERPRTITRLEIAGRVVDFERREATLPDGRRVQIPQREAEVLAYLAANPGRAVSRDELLSRVWGFDPRGVHTRTVDMAVARLREQLGDDPSEPVVIATVRGRGYMLANTEPVEADG
ncbi:MAG: DNA-binding response regulator [Planctomycetota bacterium]|nr:MAG: DNA-binding response regulator [Planctomycetota bacterium]